MSARLLLHLLARTIHIHIETIDRTTCELVAVTNGSGAAGAAATSGALYAMAAGATMAGFALMHAITISTTIAICKIERTKQNKTIQNDK